MEVALMNPDEPEPDIQKQFEEYQDHLRRYLILNGFWAGNLPGFGVYT